VIAQLLLAHVLLAAAVAPSSAAATSPTIRAISPVSYHEQCLWADIVLVDDAARDRESAAAIPRWHDYYLTWATSWDRIRALTAYWCGQPTAVDAVAGLPDLAWSTSELERAIWTHRVDTTVGTPAFNQWWIDFYLSEEALLRSLASSS